jgi:pimeloyl-ACP methyl ester carboxylesterase
MPTATLPTGIDLYYEVHGQGEPLVLIPATGFSAEVWQPYQVPGLSKDLRVIIFDQRGTGRSSTPKGVYAIEQMAADTVALLNHLGIEQAHILGHSMGGRIGLAMALDFPGRVKSLILAASGSGPAARTGDECIPGLPYHLVYDWVEKGFEEFVRHEIMDTHTYFTDDFRRANPDKVKAFYDVAWPTHARWPEYLRLCMTRHTWEGTHRLGDVAVPTLVAIGPMDTIGSNHVPQSDVMARRIPGAQLMVLEGQSHGFFWQVPEETNAWILKWVREHAG